MRCEGGKYEVYDGSLAFKEDMRADYTVEGRSSISWRRLEGLRLRMRGNERKGDVMEW